MSVESSGTAVGPTDLALEAAIHFFRPKPSPVRLVRVGGRRDGAYLIPDDFEGIGACFSPGVANRKDFEDELWHKHGICSYMVDFSSEEDNFESPLLPGAQFFQKKWLAPLDSWNSISLESWVKQSEPGDTDLLLQMDIEGGEYENLSQAPTEILARFRIMVIEFHDFRKRLFNLHKDKEFSSVLQKLRANFVVVHARANNCSPALFLPGTNLAVPDVIEVTLLRNDRLMKTPLGSARRAVLVPHPKDISRNVPRNKPVHLGDPWVDLPRPLVSRAKILADYLLWFFEVHVRHWPYKLKRLLFSTLRRRSAKMSSGGNPTTEGG
jgi:hypothetical protein